MKVARYQAHHVLGVKDIDFNLEGHHLFLVGGDNDQGKTSAIQALLMALCGRSGMDFPDVGLRQGESEGWVKVELAPDDGERGFSIELFLRRKRDGQVVEQFRVVDEDGREATEPRALLKRLYSLRAFDPLEFESLDKGARRELLCKLIGLDPAQYDAEYDVLYKQRAAVNRDGMKLKVRVDSMPHHPSAPKDEVSIADLVAERTALCRRNADNERERQRLVECQRVVDGKRVLYDAVQAELARCRAKLSELTDEFGEALESLATDEAILNAQTLTVKVLEDVDLAQIDARIARAETENSAVRANQARQEATEELDDLRDQSQTLSDDMLEVRGRQQEALESAAWPVLGLSVDKDGVLYEGLPFEQAAKSTRIMVSTMIGMALNPKLRLLVCEHGNDLGAKALSDLAALLKERDYQMLLEIVTRSPEDEARCEVVIEEGRGRA